MEWSPNAAYTKEHREEAAEMIIAGWLESTGGYTKTVYS
jgi:hypothetical protein